MKKISCSCKGCKLRCHCNGFRDKYGRCPEWTLQDAPLTNIGGKEKKDEKKVF